MKTSLWGLIIILLGSAVCYGQFTIGGSIKSRYIWRGIDLGNSPSLQPAITYQLGQFTAGIAGAYGFPDTGKGYAENAFLFSYAIPLSSGSLSLLCTDLYFPSYGANFFNTKGDGTGGHNVEIGLQYAGPESFPIITRAFIVVHNDPDNSAYFEFEYPFSIDNIVVNAIVGFAGNRSIIYKTNGIDLINIGFTAIKTIPIGATSSMFLSTSFIVNPRLEQSYLVFGIGF